MSEHIAAAVCDTFNHSSGGAANEYRKDDVIAGLKAQLERAQTELQQLKFLDAAQQVEGQKKIRSLNCCYLVLLLYDSR